MEGRLKERGQSLFEILIAVSVTAVVIGSAVAAMVVSLRSGEASVQSQKGYAILQETLSMARAYAESDWSAFYNLSPEKGTSGQELYFLSTAATTTPTSFLSVETGTTTALLSEDNEATVYTTWFTIENMYRDTNNAAATSPSGTKKDPSTLRVTAHASWGVGGDIKEISLSQQMSRIRSNSFKFSRWDSGDYASTAEGMFISSDGESLSIP